MKTGTKVVHKNVSVGYHKANRFFVRLQNLFTNFKKVTLNNLRGQNSYHENLRLVYNSYQR